MKIDIKQELFLIIKQNGSCSTPETIKLRCSGLERGFPDCPLQKECTSALHKTHTGDDWIKCKRKIILKYCIKNYSREDIVEVLI